MEIKTTKNKLEKNTLSKRVKILKEHIRDKLKKIRAAKISIAKESRKNNADNKKTNKKET